MLQLYLSVVQWIFISKKIICFKIQYGYARILSGILNSGNPSINQENLYLCVTFKKRWFSLCVLFLWRKKRQDKKKEKVYRTQSGAIIEAPRPLFERSDKKEKVKPKIKSEKSKALARTKRLRPLIEMNLIV